MTAIHGWNHLIPELAAYGVLLKRANPNDDSLTPMNLFLHGKQGTNKSGGVLAIAKILGLSSYSLDCSTVDDIKEIIGTNNLHANREYGRKELILSSFVDLDFPVLDEFLNARPHVAPQFRLALQRKLVVDGERVKNKWRGFASAGNLAIDMKVGEANLLDTPTADRFALLLRVPSLSEMSFDDFEAIATRCDESSFEDSLSEALTQIADGFESAEKEYGKQLTRFLRALCVQLADTAHSFEGRRLQVLRDLCIATLALHKAQPERNLLNMMHDICFDTLRYNMLSGIDPEVPAFEAAFKVAFEILCNEDSLETVVVMEPRLDAQVALVLKHPRQLGTLTRGDVYNRALNSGDSVVAIALKVTAKRGHLDHEPAELLAMIERMNMGSKLLKLPFDRVDDLQFMNEVERLAFSASNGDINVTRELAAKVERMLETWGVSTCGPQTAL